MVLLCSYHNSFLHMNEGLFIIVKLCCILTTSAALQLTNNTNIKDSNSKPSKSMYPNTNLPLKISDVSESTSQPIKIYSSSHGCGNGSFSSSDEECDDGNREDNDGCSHECTI